jgi:hypothetical protein
LHQVCSHEQYEEFFMIRKFLLASIVLLAGAGQSWGAISYTTAGSTYTQNFDTLTGSSWTNDSTLNGWNLFRQPSASPVAITSITSVTTLGGTPAGSFYNFASTGSSGDRAFGGIGSGAAYFGSPATNTVAGWIATNIVNSTGNTLDSFTVTYDGEQWFRHSNTSTNTMVTEYGFGNTFGGVSTWTALGANFTSPTVGAATGVYLDGNAAANRTANITATISTPWSSGSTLWIRFIENNDTGNDHGLALDNFRFTAVPEPTSMALVGLVGLGGLATRLRRKNAVVNA